MSAVPRDLADCASEPIHVPGAIQPHGALLVLREPGLEVLQASENCAGLLGLSGRLVGAALPSLLGADVGQALGAQLAAEGIEQRPRLLGRHRVNGIDCDVVAHRHEGVLIVELEPDPGTGADFWRAYELVRSFVTWLRDARSVAAMCELAAAAARGMTGFGHAMVYAFDDDGHGHVLAEDREGAYPSYLDHRFPASDIPAQARELYRRNHVRLIADAHYRPSRLQPILHPDTGRPTDLSFAGLRSVSPVHLEYMRNMGTRASTSASIIVHGRLWGLISCHDQQPRHVPHAVRTAFEHLGQVLALQIEGYQDRREIDHRLRLRELLVAMLATLGRSDGALHSLAALPDELMRFGDAGGVAIVASGRCDLIGSAPGEAFVDELVHWLPTQAGDGIFVTDRLPERFPPARPHADLAAGVLAVSLSRIHRHYLIWFRPQVLQAIQWAGNPRSPKAGDDGRLHPRASFASWREVIEGRSLPWRPSERELAAELRNAVIGVVLEKAEHVAALAQELERSNAELEAFSYSVSHDLRAPLRHIAGYADLLLDGEGAALPPRGVRFVNNIRESARFAGSLVDGLLAFSRIGRASINRSPVALDDLVASVVRSTSIARADPVQWTLEPLPVVQGDPVLLKVAVQNLIGNAVKYSAGRKPPRIAVRAVDRPDSHGLAVVDNGVGFDMRYVHKLFGVFQRLHSMDDFEGTGIGLANVRRVVERHGGEITAQGEVDRGATFTLTLPKPRLPE